MSHPTLTTLFAEGVANVRAGRWLTILAAGAAAAAVTAVTLAEAFAGQHAIDTEAAYRQAGGYRYELADTSQTPTPIDAAKCDLLARNDGISHSGGVVESRTASLANAPNLNVGLVEATPGFYRLIDADPTVFVIAADLRAELGTPDGWLLAPQGSAPGPAVMRPLSRLSPVYTRALIRSIAPVGNLSRCYIEVQASSNATLTINASMAGLGHTNLSARALLGAQIARPAYVQYNNRTTRYAWLVAAAVLAILRAVTVWLRRTELALYTAFGARSIDRTFILTAEAIVTNVPWAIAAAGLALLAAAGKGVTTEALQPAAWAAAATTAATLATTVLVGLIPQRGHPIDALKDQ